MFDGTLRKNLDPSMKGGLAFAVVLGLFLCFAVSDEEIVQLLKEMQLESMSTSLDSPGKSREEIFCLVLKLLQFPICLRARSNCSVLLEQHCTCYMVTTVLFWFRLFYSWRSF